MKANRKVPVSPALLRAPHTRDWRWLMFLSFVGLCLFILLARTASAAHADVAGFTADFVLFNPLANDAKDNSTGWFNKIRDLVRPTFVILAVIEICWAAAIWAFEKDNLNSLALEIIKKIMFIGFFFALLNEAGVWIPKIVDSFQMAGATATGLDIDDPDDSPISTDGIIATGMAVIKLIWSQAPTDVFGILGKLGQIFVACLVTIGVAVAFVVLAAQFFTLKIESYVLFAAGAIFLGMGSSSWTKEYVSKYLNYAIVVGVRLLVLILILALTLDAIKDRAEHYFFDFAPLLELLAVAVLQAILGIKAPEMAGALLNGGIGLSANSAKAAGASAIGGPIAVAGMAGKVAGFVGGKLMGGVQGAANLGKAVSAGRQVAKQEGKSGKGAVLSGLGKASWATAKELPRSLKNLTKGNSNASGQPNPGFADRAKQALQARAGTGAANGEAPASLGGKSTQAVGSKSGKAVLTKPRPGQQPAGDGAQPGAASASGGASASGQEASGSSKASLGNSGVKEFYAPQTGGKADKGDKAEKSGKDPEGSPNGDNHGAGFYAPKSGGTPDVEMDPPPPYSAKLEQTGAGASGTSPSPGNDPAERHPATQSSPNNGPAALKKATAYRDQ
jgi:type IV secretion system protein TrbL